MTNTKVGGTGWVNVSVVVKLFGPFGQLRATRLPVTRNCVAPPGKANVVVGGFVATCPQEPVSGTGTTFAVPTTWPVAVNFFPTIVNENGWPSRVPNPDARPQ